MKRPRDYEALEQEVLKELQAAGYRAMFSADVLSQQGCDFVGYVSDYSGATVGTAIQIKSGQNINFALEAANLQLAKKMTGAARGLLRTPSGYFELDETGDNFIGLSGLPRSSDHRVVIREVKPIQSLIRQQFAGVLKNGYSQDFALELLTRVRSSDGLVYWAELDAYLEPVAFLEAFSQILSQPFGKLASEFATSPEVQDVIQLLSSVFSDVTTIFDPHFGLGFASFKVATPLLSESVPRPKALRMLGFESNEVVFELAQRVSDLSPAEWDLKLWRESPTDVDWPEADLLISAPPLGLRLPIQKQFAGVVTKTFEDNAILRAAHYVAAGRIKKGAVLITGRSWLFRNDCQILRDKLLDLGVVKAVIGLPALRKNASIELVALVLRQNSDETVVADLGLDWSEYLAGRIGGLRDLLKD